MLQKSSKIYPYRCYETALLWNWLTFTALRYFKVPPSFPWVNRGFVGNYNEFAYIKFSIDSETELDTKKNDQVSNKNSPQDLYLQRKIMRGQKALEDLNGNG